MHSRNDLDLASTVFVRLLLGTSFGFHNNNNFRFIVPPGYPWSWTRSFLYNKKIIKRSEQHTLNDEEPIRQNSTRLQKDVKSFEKLESWAE